MTLYEETHYEGDVKITNRLYEDSQRILKMETKRVTHNWACIRYRLATVEDHMRATVAKLEALTTRFPH
jgi:hypothetical protein